MQQSPPIAQQHTPSELPQQQTLKILSILWYVYAGLCVIGLCVGGFYLLLAVMAFNNPDMFESQGTNEPPPEFFGWLFGAMGAAFAVFSFIIGLLALFTASGLAKRRRFMLCVITSGIICLSVPLGTALGVFTLITLYNRGVKATFDSQHHPAA